MVRLLVFVAVTAVLAYLSRRTFRVPGSHGFYRFFAEECIVALVLLNFISFRHWFSDPFSLRQLVSWFLLFVCIVPGVLGAVELRREGRPGAERPDEPWLYEFERTTRLVTTGVYERIRHPLYASLLLLAWGVFFKRPSVVALALALAASAFLVATAKAEEAENLRYFGEAYRAYRQATRMFIPLLF
jgi:protein-S-isoprenylcysteine O-methyltransferase Ste14